jgi:beta-lactamase regulating signal transducer with metallopeptidase domain
MPALASWLTARLPDLLASPLAARLGWTCLHSLWQAIAALLAIALRLVPRRSSAATNARYLIATAALVALPVAAVATFAIVEPGVNPAAATAASDAASATASRFAVDGAADPASAAHAPTIVLPPHLATAAAPPAARASFATVSASASAALDQLRPWLPAIAGVWLAGALLAAGRMTIGYWLTRRMVARGEPLADGRFQASVERWRRALGIDAAVRVLASAAVEAPVVVGWLKPVILWPAAALVGLPAHELDALVVHELAHVRRQDALMNLLQACIDVLFFHHPAAWWISGQVRAEREHCADDLAVRVLEAGHAGSRLSYAKALLALEERRQAHALALAANGGSLLDRIRRLAGVEEQPASPVRPLAAAAMASLLLAVLVTAAAPIREARADELPKDTNKIESLTVEQAKKLVEEFPGVTVEVEFKGLSIIRVFNSLPLNGLKNILPDVAQSLAGYSRGPLFLNGLTTLSAEEATALAQHKGERLSLNGLTTLSDEAATALAQHKGALYLNGLTTLSDEAAKALSQHKGRHLYLDGLTTLSAEAAKALSQHKGRHLYLNGLTTLSAEAAKALAQHKGGLSLNGLTTLSDEAATALAQYEDYLYLDGLTTLSAEAAKALAQHKGSLYLNGLTTLSDEAATALAQYEGRLELNGLTTLSAEAATALAASMSWDGNLPSLAALDSPDSVAIAKALATRKGPLSLPNLKKISPKTLSALLEKEDIDIPLIETLELIPEPDGSVTEDFVIPEGFQQRQQR